jgi:hypothetical protein
LVNSEKELDDSHNVLVDSEKELWKVKLALGDSEKELGSSPIALVNTENGNSPYAYSHPYTFISIKKGVFHVPYSRNRC